MASRVETCTEIPADKCKPLSLCPGCTILIKLTVPCQKYAFWCWAAVAWAIDRFYRKDSTLTQCLIASRQNGAGDCCQNPCSQGCSQRLDLDKVLCTVQCLDQGPVKGTLPFNDLMNRIQAEDPKPVCARVLWTGGGGHFVVIKGFQKTSNKLLIADPLEGEHLVSYDEFKDNYHGFGGWTHYYLTDRMNHGNCA